MHVETSTFRTNYGQSNGTLGIGIADLYSGTYRGEYNGYISVVRIYNKVLSTDCFPSAGSRSQSTSHSIVPKISLVIGQLSPV